MRLALVLAATIAVVVLAATTAEGATVAVRTAPDGSAVEVAFIAEPGERNQVVARLTADSENPVDHFWTLTDAGARLVPGASCVAVNSHVVRCAPQPPDFPQLSQARIELGDMDDSLVGEDATGSGYLLADGGPGHDRLTGAHHAEGGSGDDVLVASQFGFPGNFGDRLDGGPGNDRLLGREGNDELRGGGGVDDLNGGNGDDRLLDDDLDEAAGEGAPGPDRLDGGIGHDLVSYQRRTAPVFVDLGDQATDGAVGEGDRLLSVESLTGGRGDDRLAGDEGSNTLDGHGGRDRLAGRGGSDDLRRAGGSVACGPGRDTVRGGRKSRELLQPDCEILAPDYEAEVGANPVDVSRRSVRFRIQCPMNEDPDSPGPYAMCGPGTLRLTEVSGRHRTLAVGRFPEGNWARRIVNVRLTRLGRRLASRRHGARARVRLTGYYPDGPTLRWSIRLKTPR